MLTKETILRLPGFLEMPELSSILPLDLLLDEITWLFDTGNNVSMYYNSGISHCILLTEINNQNCTLFSGRIEDINELVFIINCVKAYNSTYEYKKLVTPKFRIGDV